MDGRTCVRMNRYVRMNEWAINQLRGDFDKLICVLIRKWIHTHAYRCKYIFRECILSSRRFNYCTHSSIYSE